MTENEVKEYYDNNPDIRGYINAYAVHRDITVTEAFNHQVVKEYVEWVLADKEYNPPTIDTQVIDKQGI